MTPPTLQELQALPPLQDADAATRQAVLDEYLDWLDDPASQRHQSTGGALFGWSGACCALGGLGRVLEGRGYARIHLSHLSSTGHAPGGDTTVYASPTSLDPRMMHALGLGESQTLIAELNDVQEAPFAEIGRQLRKRRPTPPA